MIKLIALLVLLLIIAVILWGVTSEYDICYSAMEYEGHASMDCCGGKCGGTSDTEYLSEICCSCPHLVLGCHPVKEKENDNKN